MGRLFSNISEVERRIERAVVKAGRARGDVTLVAVTKTVDVGAIRQAAALGVAHFGENRVQELVRKCAELSDLGANWHMVGHLQTNKVKQAVEAACMVHSVDSIRLAEEIDKMCAKLGKVTDILVEVNIAGEASKYGISAESAVNFAKQIRDYNNIRCRGLMCVAPFVENAEENRAYFRKLRKVMFDIQTQTGDNYIDSLSMGMTNDYEVAVEEGATLVRIGTAIFGER